MSMAQSKKLSLSSFRTLLPKLVITLGSSVVDSPLLKEKNWDMLVQSSIELLKECTSKAEISIARVRIFLIFFR